ncbi:MAG: arsenate reductase ArsC [Steroidobacteraceae bacterium]
MTTPIRVLFLCTHNSARSILAEAMLNHLGEGRFVAYSAGSEPRTNGLPNPLAIQALKEAGIAVDGLRSKSWDEFMGPTAPAIDLVITVCGAADAVCPDFPGAPATAHWGYADPSAGDAPDELKLLAFRMTLKQIGERLSRLVALPPEALAGPGLQAAARQLAKE